MKGHMEKDGFHPHTQYKGVRKARDQQAKLQGIRLRRESKTLSDSERKTLFVQVNSIGVSTSKTKRRAIYNKLWQDNINRAKNRLKENEKFFLTTNHLMETFGFGLDQKSGIVRTLGFIGHENKDNPEDVRRIPSEKLTPERKKRIKSVLEESNLQPDIRRTQTRIISMLRKGKSDSAITPLVAELRVMIQRRNKQMFGKTIPSQALVPYVLPKVNQDGSDAFFIDIFDAFRRAEEENLPVIFNNINGDTIEVPNERLQR